MGKVLSITDGFGKVRKLGMLNGETLRMWRNEEKHLYRKLNAWCFDADVFKEFDNIQIFIVELDDGRRFLTIRDHFEKHAKEINWSGHGVQLALPLKYWQEFREF